MKLRLLPLLACLFSLPPSYAQSYSLEVEVVSENIGILVGALGVTDLTGYSCSRLYVNMANTDDFMSSVSGDAVNPTYINTTTNFYHAILGGQTPNGINSVLFPVYPDLAYDSWVTIGLEGAPNAAAGEAAVATVQSTTNPWATNFDLGGGIPGGNITIDDVIGGAWYALNGDANGIAGDDLKVLVGQFTTTGELSGQLYCQVFINGEGSNEYRETFFIGGSAGCTDETACNYDAEATADDDSCIFPETGLDCDGNCLNDADSDGICDEDEINGCTNELACNYDSTATDEDGSCEYAATGLDCDGNCLNDGDSDGICDDDEIEGCTEVDACNYDVTATDEDGSCTYPAEAYLDCEGNCLGDSDGDGVCDELEVVGCQDEDACDYNADATDAGACDYESCAGCTYATADNYDADATIEDGSCAWAGCIYEGFSNYDPTATVDDGSCTDAPTNADFNGDGIVQNQDLLDFLLAYGQTGPEWGGLDWIQGACNVEPIPLDELITAVDYCSAPDAPENCEAIGCTYPSAANYDAAATVDSGDCVWTGCTDSEAVNFDSNASIDDGTCTYDICPDFNGDGQVQAQDLLNFLLAWGTMY